MVAAHGDCEIALLQFCTAPRAFEIFLALSWLAAHLNPTSKTFLLLLVAFPCKDVSLKATALVLWVSEPDGSSSVLRFLCPLKKGSVRLPFAVLEGSE